MGKLAGKRVLITGAAAGIGLCTALEFAKEKNELILTDIDADKLEGAAKQVRGLGATVHTYVYDVSKKKQVDDMASKVGKEVGSVDILINNAGIGHNGELADTPLTVWRRLVEVNFWGPLYHVYAFLPEMKARRQGHIVNVSSGQVFFRLPTWGAYTAIKAALSAFSEILHFELKKYDIDVTTVYPFMVDTGFYDGIEGETLMGKLSMKLVPLYSMKPESVGKIVFKAIKKKHRVEKVSLLNDLGYYAQFVPLASDIIGRVGDFVLAKRDDRIRGESP